MPRLIKSTKVSFLALATFFSHTLSIGQVTSPSKGTKNDVTVKQSPVTRMNKSAEVAVKPTETMISKFKLASIQGDHVELSATRLPIESLMDAVKQATEVPKKGEFESTAEFEVRKTAARSSSFLGGSTLNDTFAVSMRVSNIGNLTYSFNPDTNDGALFVLPFTSTGGSKSRYESRFYGQQSGLDFFNGLRRTNFPKTTYEGSNAYGATVSIEKTTSISYGLAANRIPFLSFKRNEYYEPNMPATSELAVIKFKMDSSTASKTIPDLRALIVFSLREPFVMDDFIRIEPKIDKPTDYALSLQYLTVDIRGIIWYSQSTGKIFARLPEGFGKAEVESSQEN